MAAAWKATAAPGRSTAGEWRVEPVDAAAAQGGVVRRGGEPQGAGGREGRRRRRRNNAAFQLAWLKRLDRPIDLTCLDFGKAARAAPAGRAVRRVPAAGAGAAAKDRFVCVAGYGDGGPGYIPTDEAYLEGGYEPTVALAAPCEATIVKVMAKLLKVE